MKKIKLFGILLFYLCLPWVCRSQEYNVGVELGVISDFGLNNQAVNLNGLFEFRPANAFFSINTNPGLIVTKEGSIFGSIPLFMKFIIGDKYKFCPKFGTFYWTNRRWGLTGGFNFEALFKEKLSPFLSADFIKGYYKEQIPSHFGGSSTSIDSFGILRLSIGFKYQLK